MGAHVYSLFFDKFATKITVNRGSITDIPTAFDKQLVQFAVRYLEV